MPFLPDPLRAFFFRGSFLAGAGSRLHQRPGGSAACGPLSRVAGAGFPVAANCSSPHLCIAMRTGQRLFPKGVREYSTLGGTSAYTNLFTILCLSISRNC